MVRIKDAKNYWYPGSPLGGLNKSAMVSSNPGANNIDAYLAPLRIERVKQDPLTWKESLVEAEIPMPLLSYRVKMQQMFMDTILDGHTSTCWEKRKDRVLLKDYHIVDSKGNTHTESTELIQGQWWKEIMSYGMDALPFGYTGMGIGDIENGIPTKITLIRRPNISPDRLNIAQVPYSPGGIQFMDENAKDSEGRSFKDWVIWVPTPSDFGISQCGYGFLYKVALYQILCRNNLGDNATYNELFGQSLRVGRTSKKDKESRARFAQTLDSMGAAAWMLLDEEDKVEFIDSKTNAGAANGPYDNLEQRLEKKISKIILGHADAADSTPGKLGAQGKEEDGAGKSITDKEKKDTDFVTTMMNDRVIPKLIKLGINIPIGMKFAFKNDKEKQEAADKKAASNQVFLGIVKTAKEAGYKVPAKFVEEMTGYPMEEIEEPAPEEGLIKNPNISRDVKNKLELLYK